MSNTHSTFEDLVNDTLVVAVPINMIGLGFVVWKMKKIRDPEINKTYSKISIWMLKQLMIGIVVLVIALVATFY